MKSNVKVTEIVQVPVHSVPDTCTSWLETSLYLKRRKSPTYL